MLNRDIWSVVEFEWFLVSVYFWRWEMMKWLGFCRWVCCCGGGGSSGFGDGGSYCGSKGGWCMDFSGLELNWVKLSNVVLWLYLL